jgi:hypothetical protein
VQHQAPPPLTLTDSDNATIYGDDHLMNGKFDPSHPLYQDLAPEDSYSNGVYWVRLYSYSDKDGGLVLMGMNIRPIYQGENGRNGSTLNQTLKRRENSSTSEQCSGAIHYRQCPATLGDTLLGDLDCSPRVIREFCPLSSLGPRGRLGSAMTLIM